MKKILFCIYHNRDHIFFNKIAKKFINKYDIYLLYFYKIPAEKNNCKKIYFYSYVDNISTNKKTKKKNLLHEKVWSLKSYATLSKKFFNYQLGFEKILKDLKINLVIQELGGFICHLAMLQTCQKLNLKHIFIEPSFLVEHCYFLLNSQEIKDGMVLNKAKNANKLLIKYYKLLNQVQYLAINKKDQHWKKKNIFYLIFSKYTFLTFFTKLKRIIFFQKNEFNNLHMHCLDFLSRILNHFINIFYNFVDIKKINNFIFFPLHVPKDLALTLRAPNSLDQISSLKFFLKANNYKIIFKEHPLIFSRYKYYKITKQFFNSYFLDHKIPSNFIIKKSRIVITINSKAGLESLVLNKPVIALNKNYYCGKGLANYCNSKILFNKILKNPEFYKPNPINVKKLILSLTKKCLYFDLYNNEKKSLNKSFQSLHVVIKKCLETYR